MANGGGYGWALAAGFNAALAAISAKFFATLSVRENAVSPLFAFFIEGRVICQVAASSDPSGGEEPVSNTMIAAELRCAAALQFNPPRVPTLPYIHWAPATSRPKSLHVVMAQREAAAAAKAAGGAGAAGRPAGHVVDLETSGERVAGREGWAAAAAVAGVGLAGAGVLVWWALAFHPAHQQLWMVPVGLVLLGTPLVAWLSLFASGAGRWLGRLRDGDGRPPGAAPAVVPER
ncbi:hypothetical protein C2845_PM01G00400 [Panicum miliaceum]|uniref:Uncharacterized protein n=1 Tax=Panicum miliaceum TaxID=4540 RepID=A0A3L6TRX7_PANMI|nr:hypothetical protein C2845_PM01G00400 [Panicum miliaceum]